MSDEQYELREGWVWAKIEDTVQPVGQFNPSATPEAVFRYVDVSSISNRFFQIEAPKTVAGAEAPTRARQAIRPGDVLFSTVRPYLRNVAVVRNADEGNVGSTAFCVLRSNGSVDPGYLFRWTLTNEFFEGLVPKQRGISYPAVRDADVLAQAIPLAPLAEQKRIMAKIEALFEQSRTARKALDRIPPLLKRFRQGVLAAAFRGDLTRDWREQDSDAEPASLLRDLLRKSHAEQTVRSRKYNAAPPTEGVHVLQRSDFPDTWELTELAELCEAERPITYGILKPGLNTPDGIPYVRVADIKGDRVILEGIKRTSRSIDQAYKRSRLKAGDVLLSIRGTVGRVCRVPPELDNANITQDTARISVDSRVSAEYVAMCLRNPVSQKIMAAAIRGVAVRGINIGDVRALQIPLAPLKEQEGIIARVEELFRLADAIETAVEVGRRRANTLDQSILARAFRGELVSQHPNDEPASALLERIKGAQPSATPSRKSALGVRSIGNSQKRKRPLITAR